MITPLDQPMDPLLNMTAEELKALEDWEEHFKVTIHFYILILDQIYPRGSVSRTRPETGRQAFE
jgi:hypothetical protein